MANVRGAAKRAMWISLGAAALWILGGSLSTIYLLKLGGYLGEKFGFPTQGYGGENNATLFAYPGAIAAVAVVLFCLETARRAFLAERDVRADQHHALTRLATVTAPARIVQWFAAIWGLLGYVFWLQNAVWLVGALLGGSVAPDAIAATLALVVGVGAVIPVSLVTWWLEGRVMAGLRTVIAPDARQWWDGEHWQSIAA